MQFLPNIFERYAGALRNTVQKRIIRRGTTERDFQNLKRIHLFCSILREEARENINTGRFLKDVLILARIRYREEGKNLEADVKGSGHYLLDAACFETLLLELISKPSADSAGLHAVLYEDKFIFTLTGQTITGAARALIGKLGGRLLTVKGQNEAAVMIPAVITHARTEEPYQVKDDPSDPFALVNLMLFR